MSDGQAMRPMNFGDLIDLADTEAKALSDLRTQLDRITTDLFGPTAEPDCDEQVLQSPQGEMLRLHKKLQNNTDGVAVCCNIAHRLVERLCQPTPKDIQPTTE